LQRGNLLLHQRTQGILRARDADRSAKNAEARQDAKQETRVHGWDKWGRADEQWPRRRQHGVVFSHSLCGKATRARSFASRPRASWTAFSMHSAQPDLFPPAPHSAARMIFEGF